MRRPRILLHLEQMLQAANLATQYATEIEEDEFLKDTMMQQAVAMNLQIIGEHVSRLQKKHADFLESHRDVDWHTMTGMRNRIAHGYFDLNMKVIWRTVREDVPVLVDRLPQMIEEVQSKFRAANQKPTSAP